MKRALAARERGVSPARRRNGAKSGLYCLCAVVLVMLSAACADGRAGEGPSSSAVHSGSAAPSSSSDFISFAAPPSSSNRAFSSAPSGGNAPDNLPPLHVAGTGLADPDGNPVQLKGVSTHGLAWFPCYVNEAFFRELRAEWNASVVRLALYTAESGGYCTGGDQEALKQLVRNGVQYANAHVQ